ncbi:MAG: alanine--tRNA ligase, partial [Chlorobiaceae bacterium]|nr:alanine--tRNA ligase [Chlorobiaceae bacterium]
EQQLSAEASVDRHIRQDTERNHTATHLLHGALRRILGQHVQQKGSFVNSERLRFDFSHFSKLTDSEIDAVEAEVNEQIRRSEQVLKHADVPYDEAIAKGALAFFGDKYTDRVRVVEVPDISVELCGGTHVDNIGRIGMVKIVSESSVASGVRRIEALTGKGAERLLWKEYHELQQVRHLLKVKGDEPVSGKIIELMDTKKELEKELYEIEFGSLLLSLTGDLHASPEIAGCWLMTKVVEGADGEALRQAGLALREKMPYATGLLCSIENEKVSLVCFASDKAVKELGIDAGKLIREAAQHVQGGGGGKPEFATAGGKNPDGCEKALEAFAASVRTQLEA